MIRKFILSDINGISRLIQNTLLVSNIKDYEVEVIRNLTKIFTPEAIRALSLKREIFVYEKEGEICGTISLEKDTVYSFFVAPDRQKRGVGKALLEFVERRAIMEGMRRLCISASVTAVKFYERMGYRRSSEEHDDRFGKTIRMIKTL